MSKIQTYVDWMVGIANDDSHGYDWTYRWGERGDYDCSSLTITALEKAGFPVKSKYGATYTGNLKQALLKCGFKDVRYSGVNLYNGQGLQVGDILLNETHHVAVYIGNGKLVQASINEFGGVRGGKPGDQTGREIWVRSYYLYHAGWDCVMRYPEVTQQKVTPPAPKKVVEVKEDKELVTKGSFKINGKTIELNRIIKEGSNYVNLREFAKALGDVEVGWEQSTKTVIIDKK